MRYKIEQWTITELLETYRSKGLNLNPTYQRNDIWTEKAQQDLIASIIKGMPIPNFFLHERESGLYDIADGQQRTRAILAFVKGEITDKDGNKYEDDDSFNNYLLPIIVINKDVTEGEIRDFYVKVNNTGLRLNSPELTKSEFFSSKILRLVEELSSLEEVESLGLFNEKQEERMLDREFMEELVAQLKYGITEKKFAIRKLYTENKDITDQEINQLKRQFKDIISVFKKINKVINISMTRFSQKNDFYTLFGLIKNYPLAESTYQEIFTFLIKIQDDISPSNDKCQLLQEYAFNCITQSHGKPARVRRFAIIENLVFNTTHKLNNEQKQLIKYYGLKTSDIFEVENVLLLDYRKINTKFSHK